MFTIEARTCLVHDSNAVVAPCRRVSGKKFRISQLGENIVVQRAGLASLLCTWETHVLISSLATDIFTALSKESNLMSLALLFHYLMLNMFRMLIHPSSGACDLFVELFHGLYCSVWIEVFALAYLFCGKCLVVTCVVVLESVFLQILTAAAQQSIFAETRFLKQPHTSRLNTRH